MEVSVSTRGPKCLGRSGFTLIEIIAVLAMLAVLASLALPRFVDVDASASRQALLSAVAELNQRETLTWSQVKLAPTGWVDDAGVFSQVNTGLGPEFRWIPGAAIDGGNLSFKGQMMHLRREPSLSDRAGKWNQR